MGGVAAFVPQLPLRHQRQQPQQHRTKTTERFVLQEQISSEEVNKRLEAQLEKLRTKDLSSPALASEVRDAHWMIVLIVSVLYLTSLLCFRTTGY